MGFLSLLKQPQKSYYGREAHKHIDRLIKSSRNLLIVSPYIDDYYADYLSRHAVGKSVRIISSSIKFTAAKKLQHRGVGNASVALFLSVSVNALLFLIGSYNPYLAFFSVLTGLLLVVYALVHRNNIQLKVPREFVHAKMYVGDNLAIEGSANLTFAGTHQNIESVRVITEPREVERLKRQFWTLWNSL